MNVIHDLARAFLLLILPWAVACSKSAHRYPVQQVPQATTPAATARAAKPPAAQVGLVWSTYLGGSDCDRGRDIATDQAGNIYVGGYTVSTDFPTKEAYDASYNGGEWDAFLSKFNSDGNLLWSTYLGTSGDEWSWRLAGDRAGNVCVVGRTNSTDLPTSGRWATEYHGGNWDCFVTKFSADGAPLWSTYLGGNDHDLAYGAALDEAGSVYVTGRTGSADFPTPGGWDRIYHGGGHDVFVSKFSADGQILWSTYLGGSGKDYAYEIAVDARGNVYVTGETYSTDFPTIGGYDATFNGGDCDAYVAKFSAGGNLLWSTYLGGNSLEKGTAASADGAAHVYVTGRTMSADFPTPAGYDSSYNGEGDVFVSKFDRDGALLWSTFLGGSGYEIGNGVAVDAGGNIYVSGNAASANFPTPGGWDTSYNGGDGDIFLSKFSGGGALLWSTFLGGGANEQHGLVTLDGMGNICITGDTDSTDFPTPGGWDTTYNGGDQLGGDAFVAKLRQIEPIRAP